MSVELFEGSASSWDVQIASLPGAHVLQTWEWGQVKSRFGWQPAGYLWRDASGVPEAAALVLTRSAPLPGPGAHLKVMYIPKGPLLAWENQDLRREVLADLVGLARRQGALFLKLDPDVRAGMGVPGEAEASEDSLGISVVADLKERGWQYSDDQIQFRNTVLVDLRPDPKMMLERMKQKTRYNIRLAERKGVVIRVGEDKDLDLLYRMYAETANRDGFVIRDQAYYRLMWDTFLKAGLAEALIAEVDGEPSAAAVIMRFAGRAYYMNGMSREAHREKMPNHLLQWQAMLHARAAGACWYDFWGAPDVFDPGDSMWGVFRFKEGFGGEVVRHIGAWDLPLRPALYWLYTRVLPRLLEFTRRRGKERTRRGIERTRRMIE